MTQQDKMRAFQKASRASVKTVNDAKIAHFKRASAASVDRFNASEQRRKAIAEQRQLPSTPMGSSYAPVSMNGTTVMQSVRDRMSDSDMTTDDYLRMFF